MGRIDQQWEAPRRPVKGRIIKNKIKTSAAAGLTRKIAGEQDRINPPRVQR